MPRTPGKALADTRHAIIRKGDRDAKPLMVGTKSITYIQWSGLGGFREWISQMDERALTRKGGQVRPWRPVRKVPGTGLKKLKSK